MQLPFYSQWRLDLRLVHTSRFVKKSSPFYHISICLAQVVYKPSEQAIVDSERSNDRKFSFLSSETKPDYRPLAERGNSKKFPMIPFPSLLIVTAQVETWLSQVWTTDHMGQSDINRYDQKSGRTHIDTSVMSRSQNISVSKVPGAWKLSHYQIWARKNLVTKQSWIWYCSDFGSCHTLPPSQAEFRGVKKTSADSVDVGRLSPISQISLLDKRNLSLASEKDLKTCANIDTKFQQVILAKVKDNHPDTINAVISGAKKVERRQPQKSGSRLGAWSALQGLGSYITTNCIHTQTFGLLSLAYDITCTHFPRRLFVRQVSFPRWLFSKVTFVVQVSAQSGSSSVRSLTSRWTSWSQIEKQLR